MLTRLNEAQLILKIEKCDFFKTEVNNLGHVVSADGLRPQPSNVKAVTQMGIPKTINELQSFLGMINYYRKFLKDFCQVASPLHNLMKDQLTRRITTPH